MLEKSEFWLALMAGMVLFYCYALLLLVQGLLEHSVLMISLILLAVHALEIPLASRAVKARGIGLGRLLLPTLLFGIVWWLPASRGTFSEAHSA
ncbi:hypothetical protein SAMN04488038_11288 [Solimonas aquatica]|uniref:DUF1145 domain-containing protein n=1 Tax=Solimonas aquatica TaxID=489703 RepID=A0A1H9JVH2_9GAMM|nr:hypothetical protein [Solimonas aquatica]SEQ90764.1 hypothetical protein SAMN04488038_11288 [Solimonas aquatica]